MEFQNQLLIGRQINMKEQLELFKKLINFAMLDLKSVNVSIQFRYSFFNQFTSQQRILFLSRQV